MKKTKYNESGTTILLTLFVTVIMLTLITSIVIATYSSSRKITDWNRSKLAEIKTENVLYEYLNEKVLENISEILDSEYQYVYQERTYQIKITKMEQHPDYLIYAIQIRSNSLSKYFDVDVKLSLSEGIISKYEILTKVFVNE